MRRCALVTGAGGAVCRGVVAALAADGYRVSAVDADRVALGAAVATLDPERVHTRVGRPGDPDHRQAAVERTLALFGRIDVLVTAVDAPADDALPGDPVAWISTADQAWMAEHGGSVFTVVGRQAVRPVDDDLPRAVGRLTTALQDGLGPGIRVTSLLPPPGNRTIPTIPTAAPTSPLHGPAEVPDVIRYLLRRRGSSLAGRVLAADRVGAAWSVLDAPLAAPSGPRRPVAAETRPVQRGMASSW